MFRGPGRPRPAVRSTTGGPLATVRSVFGTKSGDKDVLRPFCASKGRRGASASGISAVYLQMDACYPALLETPWAGRLLGANPAHYKPPRGIIQGGYRGLYRDYIGVVYLGDYMGNHVGGYILAIQTSIEDITLDSEVSEPEASASLRAQH